MFRRSHGRVKSNFRKLLKNITQFYDVPLSREEANAIIFTWQGLVKDGSVKVIRFQKDDKRLGCRVQTSENKRSSYLHRVSAIIEEKSIIKNTNIKEGDILLEVNGVNVSKLNYDELVVLLSNLPENVQIVYQMDCYFSKFNSTTSMSSFFPTNMLVEGSWIGPIKIIVHAKRKKSHGLKFRDMEPNQRHQCKCAIQEVDKEGYCYEDGRISTLDCILQIDNFKLTKASAKDLNRFFANLKNCFIMTLLKYKSEDYSSSFKSDISSYKERCASLPNNSRIVSKRTILDSSAPDVTLRTNPKSLKKFYNEKPACKESQTLIKSSDSSFNQISVTIEPSDGLGIYLIDKKQSDDIKCIVCGFHKGSALGNKMKICDQIKEINGRDVTQKGSFEIGKILKRLYHQAKPIKVAVIRKVRCDTLSDITILTDGSEDDTELYSSSSEYPSSKDIFLNEYIHVSLHRNKSNFGITIKHEDGPMILCVSEELEESNKMLIKEGDKIERINDIYVRDKSREFILTLIQSCGNVLNLELFRESMDDVQKDNKIYTF